MTSYDTYAYIRVSRFAIAPKNLHPPTGSDTYTVIKFIPKCDHIKH